MLLSNIIKIDLIISSYRPTVSKFTRFFETQCSTVRAATAQWARQNACRQDTRNTAQ